VTEMTDDPTMRRIQKIILDRLKDNKNPVIAEMAREIAAGRLTPRDALSIDSYAEAMFKSGRAEYSRIAALPAEEREALAEQARQAADELTDDDTENDRQQATSPSATAHRPRRPRRRPEIEDDEPTGSIMVGAPATPARPAEPVVHTEPEAVLPRSVRERARTGRRGR
jgi:hypothetical protein